MRQMFKEYYEIAVEEEYVAKFDEWLNSMRVRFARTNYEMVLPQVRFRIYKIETTYNGNLVIRSVNDMLKIYRSNYGLKV